MRDNWSLSQEKKWSFLASINVSGSLLYGWYNIFFHHFSYPGNFFIILQLHSISWTLREKKEFKTLPFGARKTYGLIYNELSIIILQTNRISLINNNPPPLHCTSSKQWLENVTQSVFLYHEVKKARRPSRNNDQKFNVEGLNNQILILRRKKKRIYYFIKWPKTYV